MYGYSAIMKYSFRSHELNMILYPRKVPPSSPVKISEEKQYNFYVSTIKREIIMTKQSNVLAMYQLSVSSDVIHCFICIYISAQDFSA